jgi:hypothetical protein
MPRALLAAAVLFAAWSTPSTAEACSCMRPGPPDVERDRADLVFVGTVTGAERTARGDGPLGGDVVVTFGAVQLIKGEPPSPLAIKTAASSAACGYNFEAGSEYLVYAHDRDGEPWVGLCSRTALHRRAGGEPIAEVAAEIDQLTGGPTDAPPADAPPPADTPPPATAPQKRGCAGCSSPGSRSGLVILVLIALAAARGKRRRGC